MSKVSASAKNAAGNIQESLGKVFNSDSLVTKGEQKQLQAQEQKIAAEEDKGITHNSHVNPDHTSNTTSRLHDSQNHPHPNGNQVDGHQVAADAHIPSYAAGTGMPGVGNPASGEQHSLSSESHHTSMGTQSSTASGKKNQISGKVKETTGNVTNNPSLEARGEAQHHHGHLENQTTDGHINSIRPFRQA